eukprot:2158806-Pyramimonas_sp.AAC.1
MQPRTQPDSNYDALTLLLVEAEALYFFFLGGIGGGTYYTGSGHRTKPWVAAQRLHAFFHIARSNCSTAAVPSYAATIPHTLSVLLFMFSLVLLPPYSHPRGPPLRFGVNLHNPGSQPKYSTLFTFEVKG